VIAADGHTYERSAIEELIEHATQGKPHIWIAGLMFISKQGACCCSGNGAAVTNDGRAHGNGTHAQPYLPKDTGDVQDGPGSAQASCWCDVRQHQVWSYARTHGLHEQSSEWSAVGCRRAADSPSVAGSHAGSRGASWAVQEARRGLCADGADVWVMMYILKAEVAALLGVGGRPRPIRAGRKAGLDGDMAMLTKAGWINKVTPSRPGSHMQLRVAPCLLPSSLFGWCCPRGPAC
jgi:hypothetical protein